ncbi:VOC family protein [Klebsiella pneumoniae subsp. pneumoniae]|nr:VOC family protein [Klebsiella pneumoniae subsp. pneumoniae]
MATLQWDHAVQFVNQPEAAIEIFAGQQLRAVAGGRHPGWGTRNALSYFGLTYIEFLAIADPDEPARRDGQIPPFRATPHGCCRRMRRCFGMALRSDDIDATYDQLPVSYRVTVSPIVDGQRNDPAGQYHPLAGSSPSMATLTGWSIPLCCSGRRRRHPADAAARPEAGRAASAGRHYA